MRRYLLVAALLGLTWACSNNSGEKGAGTTTPADGNSPAAGAGGSAAAGYDSLKGAGKFAHIDLSAKADDKLAAGGKAVYELKCSACHKLNSEKLVGPGWLGVTERRKPEWIMNFVTNTDEMIDKDPHAQALLQECLVRMPNQHLSDEDARNVLEFMRKNDQSK
ncbi:c-type cytochrome [Puia sp. P3]|uniref:c-type cytochrome n=1 Tax=Puia sp. P3 TaxID=3423952 RepID=UPI003D66839E